ncbi:MAG: hypothetical protein AVDCRST_MAG05-911, partial [uncultured Rubrobacteraceae bacterium]
GGPQESDGGKRGHRCAGAVVLGALRGGRGDAGPVHGRGLAQGARAESLPLPNLPRRCALPRGEVGTDDGRVPSRLRRGAGGDTAGNNRGASEHVRRGGQPGQWGGLRAGGRVSRLGPGPEGGAGLRHGLRVQRSGPALLRARGFQAEERDARDAAPGDAL